LAVRIDGFKGQTHRLIDQIAGSGVSVLMVSSELPYLIGISDRAYVMREGGVAAELRAGPEVTQERVVACMV
jgi:ribose transport system ATP-binding protein